MFLSWNIDIFSTVKKSDEDLSYHSGAVVSTWRKRKKCFAFF